MTTTNDFARLLSAVKVLGRSGNTAGAKALVKAAQELLPASKVGLCARCVRRLKKDSAALRAIEAAFREAADGRIESAAATR